MLAIVGLRRLGGAAMTAVVAACTAQAVQRAEPSLGPLEQTVDAKARAVWPGQTGADGTRIVPTINGFFDGAPLGCWMFGPSSRNTADAFFFCRDNDPLCPLSGSGRAQWPKMVGDPVFARMPGETGYSPYWLVWVVRVPEDYTAGELKSVEGIKAAATSGSVRVEQLVFDHGGSTGPGPAVMHCALVLGGTQLAPPRDAAVVPEDRQGWHKRYRVHFYDFSATEGVSPADSSSQSRPLMIVGDLVVLQRDCAAGSTSPVCGGSGPHAGWVSERDAGVDLSGDGDRADTNFVFSAKPSKSATDPGAANYSPLWRVSSVRVQAAHDTEVALIDTTGAQDQSAVKSWSDLQSLISKTFSTEAEPIAEATIGVTLPGNDGQAYFSCPAQVAPAP